MPMNRAVNIKRFRSALSNGMTPMNSGASKRRFSHRRSAIADWQFLQPLTKLSVGRAGRLRYEQSPGRSAALERNGCCRPAGSLLTTAVLLFGLLGTGCHTTPNPPAAEAVTAAVQIRGNTPGQITQMVTEVFQEHGYTQGSKRAGALVFEKPGSKLSNLAYGSWLGETPVWVRVKLSIIPSGEQQYTLRCQAYRVQDKGSSTEEELKIGKMGNGPYQKLLEEVASRFKPTDVAWPAVPPSADH